VSRPAPGARRRRVRRAVGPASAIVLLVGALFLGVFPARTFLTQRAATAEAVGRLAVLERESAALERRAAELRGDAEIERLAREQHHLVRPGEEAYAVLPAPPGPAPGPAGPGQPGDSPRRGWLRGALLGVLG
jgi:cell division protein FtsB